MLVNRRRPLVRVVFNKWKHKAFTNVVVSRLVDSLKQRCWNRWRERVKRRDDERFAVMIHRRVLLWKLFLKWRNELDRKSRELWEISIRERFYKKKCFLKWKEKYEDKVYDRKQRFAPLWKNFEEEQSMTKKKQDNNHLVEDHPDRRYYDDYEDEEEFDEEEEEEEEEMKEIHEPSKVKLDLSHLLL